MATKTTGLFGETESICSRVNTRQRLPELRAAQGKRERYFSAGCNTSQIASAALPPCSPTPGPMYIRGISTGCPGRARATARLIPSKATFALVHSGSLGIHLFAQ